MAADRPQARMDRAGRARATAGLFAAPAVRHAARVVPRGRQLLARYAPRIGRLRREQGRRQVQASRIRRWPGADRGDVCRRVPLAELDGQEVLHHDGESIEPARPEQSRSSGGEAPLRWRSARSALHRLGSAGPGRASRVVHPASLQHDRAGQSAESRAAGLARLQVLHVVVGWHGRALRHDRRRADGAAGQHECRADHVRGLPFDGMGALSGQGDGAVSRARRQRPCRRHEHRRRSTARRDQRRLRKLSRTGIRARGQRRPVAVHRQPTTAVSGAFQRGLWPLPRPAAGVRRADQRLHAADQRDRRTGRAGHQPARAHHQVHRPGQEGADHARGRARGQHLARRRPLEQAASAVRRFPEVEDVPERSAAGDVFGLPRHARQHAQSALGHS